MSLISGILAGNSSYSLRAFRPNATAVAFAHEIVSRARPTSALAPVPAAKPAAPESDLGPAGMSSVSGAGAATGMAGAAAVPAKDLDAPAERLESSLAGTVAYMTEKFGDKAGTSMMGLMAKSLGDGEVDEASLSAALLNVVKFVDQNFGIAEGDSLIDHLNGSLNDSLNDFFDNGHDELFMAKTIFVSGGSGAAPAGAAEQSGEAVPGMVDNILAMLESYKVQRKKTLPLLPYQNAGNLPTGVMVDTAT